MLERSAIAVSVIGAICFVIGALYLGAHPDHRWHEITGEPEMVPVRVEDGGGSVATVFE